MWPKLSARGLTLVLAGFLLVFLSPPVLGESVKIGILLPLTGKLAPFGEMEKWAFDLAFEEINAGGGVRGKRLEHVVLDTQGRQDAGRAAMKRLTEAEQVQVVGGGISSSAAWSAAAVAQKKKVPFLINTASADKITEQGWGYVFRLNTPVSEYPRALASFLRSVAPDLRNVAILHEETAFGYAWARDFWAQCDEHLGLEVIMKQGYEAGAEDLRPLLARVKARGPHMVYLASHLRDGVLLMQQARELNLNPKLFLGSASDFTLPAFRQDAGQMADFVFSVTLWTPSLPYPGAREFYDKFLGRYGKPPDYHGAQAYAAAQVLAEALKKAASFTPEEVKGALAKTDLTTVFGPVRFREYEKKTHQNLLPTYLVQWSGENLHTVWPGQAATAKYVYPFPKWNER